MTLFWVYTCIIYHICGIWSWRTDEMHSIPFQNRVWQRVKNAKRARCRRNIYLFAQDFEKPGVIYPEFPEDFEEY
jgi:predicted metalloprotease